MKKTVIFIICIFLLLPSSIIYASPHVELVTRKEITAQDIMDSYNPTPEKKITGQDIIDHYNATHPNEQTEPNTTDNNTSQEQKNSNNSTNKVSISDNDLFSNIFNNSNIKKFTKKLIEIVLVIIATCICLAFVGFGTSVERERRELSQDLKTYISILEFISMISFFILCANIGEFIRAL